MALVERLMHIETPHISEHTFFAANLEIIAGRLTVAQVKTYLQMDAAAIAEYDALIALAPTGSTTAALIAKSDYVQKIHAVFLLAGAHPAPPGYATPAEVRIKLGI